jgi:methionyl-tRNA formyltransferase
MVIVFFGTPQFAVPTLQRLLDSIHTVAGVVTQPDRPSGRGQRVTDAPVKALAVERHIPVMQPERLKPPDVAEAMRAWQPDLGVVAAYGRIIPEHLLAVPRLGMINVHASLLPRYRGAAPVHRAVIDGEDETGVTIMRVVKALDAGPMLTTVRRPIGPDETSDEVERDLARLGAHLLVSATDALAAGRGEETPQDDHAATYAHRLTKEDGVIDWTWPAARLHDQIRGLHPWPHAFTFLHGRRFILIRSAAEAAGPEGPEGGTILDADGDRLVVAAGSGQLHVIQIQAEGKRPMGAREFLAGHRLIPGDRFTAAAPDERHA